MGDTLNGPDAGGVATRERGPCGGRRRENPKKSGRDPGVGIPPSKKMSVSARGVSTWGVGLPKTHMHLVCYIASASVMLILVQEGGCPNVGAPFCIYTLWELRYPTGSKVSKIDTPGVVFRAKMST